MADAKITALTELTAKDDSDLLAIVDDPAGTPVTKKITVTNLKKNPIIILDKTTGSNQNFGGANGTEVWWSWDNEVRKDTGFTHSNTTNNTRIQVDADGWYRIRLIGNVQQTGSARATLQGIYRVNGGTTKRNGTIRDYSRGSAYGNLSPGLEAIVQLTNGDYIEVGTRVEDADATYTLYNCDGTEVTAGESMCVVERLP